MKTTPANVESYKAGAKAFGDAGRDKATNHLDRQKLQAKRDDDQSRKRATLHLPKIKD